MTGVDARIAEYDGDVRGILVVMCLCGVAGAEAPSDGGVVDARTDDQKQLDGMLPELEACFRGNVAYINLSAMMRVQLTVAADGKVKRARLLKAYIPMPAYHGQCVMTALRKARLAAGKARVVTHELVWRHGRPEDLLQLDGP